MSLSIDAYLDRINYSGPRHVSAEGLIALHKAHAYAVPYENIDVILRKPVSQNLGHIFDKLVTRRRGGWCYEQNGLFGWALQQLGFSVTRLCGSVNRSLMGDVVTGNHLVLRVDLDMPWIADVGFGGYFAEPYRLEEGSLQQGGWGFHLQRLPDGQWRFSNRGKLDPPDYDFIDAPADEASLAKMCEWQQDSPESNFRNKLICSIATPGGAKLLSNQRWSDRDFQTDLRMVQDAREMGQLLQDGLGIALDEQELEPIWQFARTRQELWEAEQQSKERA